MNESKLTEVIGKGEYDLFHWCWTPFVDPDFMLSVFQCNQVAKDPADPTNYYNDANWCDPEYDKLYKQQKVELDPEKRRELVHEMLTRFYRSAVYVNLVQNPDLEAYRTDRFEGWLRQPAEVGPVIFTNTSPTYFNLTPIEGGGSDSGMSSTRPSPRWRSRERRRSRARVRADAPPHGRGARVGPEGQADVGTGGARAGPPSTSARA